MVRIAVQGCCHGELDKIYETVEEINASITSRRLIQGGGGGKEEELISLLICCGDFQAFRNEDDLECMACPPKYRSLGDFHRYYSGQKVRIHLRCLHFLIKHWK